MADNKDNPLSFAMKTDTESKFERHSVKMTELIHAYDDADKEGRAVPVYRHQLDAVLKTKAFIGAAANDNAQPKIALIQAPAGCGKSGVIVLLPYVLNSQKVLVLTPSKVISRQLSIAFGYRREQKSFFEIVEMVRENKIKHDVLEGLLEKVQLFQTASDVETELGKLVIVNAQKFGGDAKLGLVQGNEEIIGDARAFFQEFDTLIVDEAHHYPAQTWLKIVEEFNRPVEGMEKATVFVTATANKIIDGKKDFFLGSGKEAKEYIAHVITPEEVVGVSTRCCKFKQLSHEASDANVLKDILTLFEENSKLEPRLTPQAMVLVKTKQEAKDLAEYMNRKSDNQCFAVAVLGDTSGEKNLSEFTRGKYRVAITCGVAMEGFDNVNVVVCVILRKLVKERILFNQFVGRCIRMHRGLGGDGPDKSIGVVLSYPEFEQERMWKKKDQLAVEDPLEVDEIFE